MGLTIHYRLKSTTTSTATARQLVEKMRQLAFDLPFDSVSEITELSGDDCQYDPDGAPDDPVRWLLIQSTGTVKCPWNANIGFSVVPVHVIAFTVHTGEGCADLNIGLCLYPSEIERYYMPMEDVQFHRRRFKGDTIGEFDHRKWRRHANKRPLGNRVSDDHEELRKINTRLSGWQGGALCTTQYASNPKYGGVTNFLRLHLSAVTLLERIGELPTVTVEIDDEGHYGPARYSDDWREAIAKIRQPTYVWHPATHNLSVLLKEVGDYNRLMAAFVGTMKDANGDNVDAPILQFRNFESLEFSGHNSEELGAFLNAMAGIAVASGKHVQHSGQ